MKIEREIIVLQTFREICLIMQKTIKTREEYGKIIEMLLETARQTDEEFTKVKKWAKQ